MASTEYKQSKAKAAVRLYTNEDAVKCMVRRFEERSEETGRRSLVKDAKKYAKKFRLSRTIV